MCNDGGVNERRDPAGLIWEDVNKLISFWV